MDERSRSNESKDERPPCPGPREMLMTVPPGYVEILTDLKERIRKAQIKAALSVNKELLELYWDIGREISRRRSEEGWGAKIIDRLASDLRTSFPDMKGISPRNLKYMRTFAEAWPESPIGQQLAAQLPWGHIMLVLDKAPSREERDFYVASTHAHGWSRNVLAMQIESGLFRRRGAAVTNFVRTLPPLDSELAAQTLKDPYNFDFLTLGDDAREREIERGLLEHLRAFMIELGVGFAFVGSQYHVEVGAHDFYIDLLFYHLKLRCFMVIELKNGDFKPEYAGKMNFYLSAVDDLLRHADDKPSIGLILCRGKDRVVAEYALRDIDKPIGVSGFKLTEKLPTNLQASLPTVEQLEAELEARESENPDKETK